MACRHSRPASSKAAWFRGPAAIRWAICCRASGVSSPRSGLRLATVVARPRPYSACTAVNATCPVESANATTPFHSLRSLVDLARPHPVLAMAQIRA